MVDKGINAVDLNSRKKDLQNIRILVQEFGNQAYRALEKYYTGIGYETGIERLTELIRRKKFLKDRFIENPVKGVEEFLSGYFEDRGGNMPTIWTEKDTVYLMTEVSVACVTIAAERDVEIQHRDICHVYCRAVAKGLILVFEDLLPGIQIQFYNVSSRRGKDGKDCVEAFKIIFP